MVKMKRCDACDGHGAIARFLMGTIHCSTCNGTGLLWANPQTALDWWAFSLDRVPFADRIKNAGV